MNIRRFTIPIITIALILASTHKSLAQNKKTTNTQTTKNVQIDIETYDISALDFAHIITTYTESTCDQTQLRDQLKNKKHPARATLINKRTIKTKTNKKTRNTYNKKELISYSKFENPYNNSNLQIRIKKQLPPLPPMKADSYKNMLGTEINTLSELSKDGKTISLQFEKRTQSLIKFQTFQEWKIKNKKTLIQVPIIYLTRINTQIKLKPNIFSLIAANTPEINGNPDQTKKRLTFVKIQILNDRKNSTDK